MGLFSVYWLSTLVSGTYVDKNFKNTQNNRKDVYIHQIIWNLVPTDYSEFTAANLPDNLIQLMISASNLAAMAPLSTRVPYRATIGACAAAAELGTVVKLELSGVIEFVKPIRIPRCKEWFLAVESLFAGEFSVRVLVSENDV